MIRSYGERPSSDTAADKPQTMNTPMTIIKPEGQGGCLKRLVRRLFCEGFKLIHVIQKQSAWSFGNTKHWNRSNLIYLVQAVGLYLCISMPQSIQASPLAIIQSDQHFSDGNLEGWKAVFVKCEKTTTRGGEPLLGNERSKPIFNFT